MKMQRAFCFVFWKIPIRWNVDWVVRLALLLLDKGLLRQARRAITVDLFFCFFFLSLSFFFFWLRSSLFIGVVNKPDFFLKPPFKSNSTFLSFLGMKYKHRNLKKTTSIRVFMNNKKCKTKTKTKIPTLHLIWSFPRIWTAYVALLF